MVEAFDSSEEAKRGLLHEVASLRKQSVFALILAVLFILLTVYLYFQLRESQADLKVSYTQLEKSNANLQASQKLLEAQNDSILELKNQLNDFREKYLIENLPATVELSPSYANRPRAYRKYSTANDGTWDACFGYIVYIQDRRGSKVSDDIREALKEKGAIVPSIEHMGESVKFSNEVRYFHKEDKGMADFMQGLILKTLSSKQISYSEQQLPVSYIANDQVPLGQLEIWIDQ